MIYWMTGLSGSGKSTIAEGASRLRPVDILDGDVCRAGICRGLGFTHEGRQENLRRIAHLARHLGQHTDVLVCCISPYESVRQMAREVCGDIRVVYVKASVDACRARDPKGLYARADAGEIPNFTGVQDPYEAPEDADLVIDTEQETPEESIQKLANYIAGKRRRFALYIGRWQPLHNGHMHIMQQRLDAGDDVAIGVRDVPLNDGDPYPLGLRVEMVKAAFRQEVTEGRVVVFPVVDIASINIGRNVGYEIKEIEVAPDVAAVSATEIRRRIHEDDDWEQLVPAGVVEVLKRDAAS
jgi:adenylylsulfate kinase